MELEVVEGQGQVVAAKAQLGKELVIQGEDIRAEECVLDYQGSQTHMGIHM